MVFMSSSPEHRKITSRLCDGLADGDKKDKLKLASTMSGWKESQRDIRASKGKVSPEPFILGMAGCSRYTANRSEVPALIPWVSTVCLSFPKGAAG